MDKNFKFSTLVPEFYVSDFSSSLNFYTNVIGFEIQFTRTDPDFAYLCLGDAQIMIQQIEPTDIHTGALDYPFGRGVNFEIAVNNVDELASALKAAGYELMLEPTDFWRQTGDQQSGTRELRVLDPDGYYLRFSSELSS